MDWVGGQAGVEGGQYICTMSWLWDDNFSDHTIFRRGNWLTVPAYWCTCWDSVRLGMESDCSGLIRYSGVATFRC